MATRKEEAEEREATTGRSPGGGLASPRPRSDVLARREVLLDAVGRLLAGRGRRFSLPQLAKEAGLSTATAYRHFLNVQAAIDAYYERLIHGLVTEIRSLRGDRDALDRLDRICALWIRQAARWSRAAVELRSPAGFLERVRADGALVTELYEELAAVVRDLIDEKEIPPQSVDYATLMWITVFDERVIADVLHTLGWSIGRTTDALRASLLGALSRPGAEVGSAERRSAG